ncbi:Na+/melibiose symporter-like transporter [Microterricola gilva]|uniref:Na+/melibiose symporter-like transporter n=1 Tax=Microterricola gilva TaxID=393267 RepID=A0A4Q8AND0_9MICO|nr:MFS transporter [Microterricola gilva]RZU66142.1 Na+/melibiose symporter-like transporter [Microterricola gilva]
MANPITDADISASTVPSTAPPEKLTPQLRRFFSFIVPVNIAIYLVIGAVPGVLLPLQVQGIDEANKAANLAIITGIGAVAAMIVSPIAGLISDRTRSRFGRRAPWMLGGAIATGLALVGMGFANGVVQLVIAWTIVQITLNLVISPLTALLPDRVPTAVRGLFATLSGIGMMVGALGGQVLGAAFAQNIQAAYLVLPGIMIVVITLFVILSPDASSKDRINEPFSLVVFLKTFWVSPRRHPDFFWGFLSRLFLFTGYFTVTGYQLYILQDYIGLGDDAIGLVPVLGVVSLIGIVISTAFSGPLSDRIRRRKPFVMGASIVMAIAMLLPLAMPSVLGMIVFTALCGLGFGAYMAVDSALMSEVLPSEGTFAKDLGVLNIAATLPQTIGPFLSGAIVVAFGYPALFPVGLVLAVLGALVVIPIKSVR